MIDLIKRYYTIITSVIRRNYLTVKNRFLWNFNNSNKTTNEYINWLCDSHFDFRQDFVPISESSVAKNSFNIKPIAFYLPQFYETELNNKYFGKGFMEWYTVTKTFPHYTGHYQPHLPIDTGFYKLDYTDTMYRQLELAKKYGIYGFCFYYYWYRDETLLEKPIKNFLETKNLDMPFCFMWVNGDWNKTWGIEGKHEKEVIKKMELLDGDDEKFFQDILPYFQDSRYIKVDNKPVLAIIKPHHFSEEQTISFMKHLDKRAKEYGFNGIRFMTTNTGFYCNDAEKLGFDGVIEFEMPKSTMTAYQKDMSNLYVDPHYKGIVYDIKKALANNKHLENLPYKAFKCCAPGWDNTPRKAYSGCVVFDMGPNDYKKWFSDAIRWTIENHKQEERFVFINAWNEWAEGAHLEPDQHYGYAYLQATKEAIEESCK